MTLTNLDKELLELLALQVPWYMVCGEFHERYGSAARLAQRIVELQHAEILEIRSKDRSAPPVSAQDLERDALENDCYDDLEATREPQWTLVATEKGFRLIEDRLREQ